MPTLEHIPTANQEAFFSSIVPLVPNGTVARTDFLDSGLRKGKKLYVVMGGILYGKKTPNLLFTIQFVGKVEFPVIIGSKFVKMSWKMVLLTFFPEKKPLVSFILEQDPLVIAMILSSYMPSGE